MLLQQLFTKYDISVILEWAETAPHEKEVVHVAKKIWKKNSYASTWCITKWRCLG